MISVCGWVMAVLYVRSLQAGHVRVRACVCVHEQQLEQACKHAFATETNAELRFQALMGTWCFLGRAASFFGPA